MHAVSLYESQCICRHPGRFVAMHWLGVVWLNFKGKNSSSQLLGISDIVFEVKSFQFPLSSSVDYCIYLYMYYFI